MFLIMREPNCCPKKNADTRKMYVYQAKPIPEANRRAIIMGIGM
jgi:hypothetical protein